MAIYVAAAAATAVVGGTLESSKQQKKAREATERATEQSRVQFAAEQRKADIQNVRSVRQQIRQARLAQGSMVNTAAQTGGMGGSALAGGTSSVNSQLGSNLDYMSQVAKENTAIGTAALGYSTEMANASIAGSKAANAANIASTGMTIFSAVGGPAVVKKWME
jgi:hypothetical protein